MRLNYKRTVFVGLAFMSLSAFWQVYDTVIPLILESTFGMTNTNIGVVMALDNVLALFMLPIFGKLSDATRTHIGRRMPYILVGSFIAICVMFLMPIGESQNNLVLFLVGLGLSLIAMAIYRSPAVALMPDVTPKPLRSKGNAIINLMGATGGILMLITMSVFPTTGQNPMYLQVFVVLGVVMAMCIALLFWKIKEPLCVEIMKQESEAAGIYKKEDENDSVETNHKKLPKPVFKSLLFILASIFLWFFGYNAVVSTFSRYASTILGGNYANVLLACTAAAILAYLPVGIISSNIGRKKTILIGIVMLATAFTAGIFFTSITLTVYIFFIFAGFGWAFINVNSYPMVVELSGGYDVGKYTGYYYTVSMSAQILTPILSGWLMDEISMRILFPYATFFVIASFITMLFVKHGDSKPKPKKGLEMADVED